MVEAAEGGLPRGASLAPATFLGLGGFLNGKRVCAALVGRAWARIAQPSVLL